MKLGIHFRYSLMILALAACLVVSCTANAPTPAVTEVAEVVQLSGRELRMYNYDTYIDPAILESFQEQYDIKIQYAIFETQEQMYESLQGGGTSYDLVVVTDYLVPSMISEGLLSPLEKENIPNFENISADFISPAFDPGNRYCVPYLWGTIGIGYNSQVVKQAPTSWLDIFNSQHIGRVALLDDYRAQMGIFLLQLGYSPNTTDPVQIAEMQTFIKGYQDRVHTVAADTGQDLLSSGEVDLVVEYNGDILQLQAENPIYQYTIPQEGSILWVDSICIPSNATNHELAETFINFLLEPQVGAALANYTRYSTPNEAALPFINPEDRDNTALYPSDELRRKLFLIVDVSESVNQFYETAWSNILAGIDQ